MNFLETALVDGAIRATAFAVVGIGFYLIMRRWSPAAGSLTAGATLLLMGAVSLLAPCPWLRFPAGRLRLPVVEAIAGRVAAPPGEPRDHPGTSAPAAANRVAPPTEKGSPAVDVLLEWFARASDGPVARASRSAWTWRDCALLGFAAGLLVGTIRLAAGLGAIARIRARSRPVGDHGLIETLEILRAEMSCAGPVELRVAADLATAATVGWRRAIILLPEEWRGWDEAERRAVLAHELAHVCRGDFLTGLLAQLSLAVQFYHPLAHWLSARLRLEQELAADAWTARLSGGNLPYLTTLARMALRRDDRAPGWPARAFLPSRGTFVRRIEMLRNSKNVRHALPSRATRLLTVGALAALGLLAAGLRRPFGPSPALAQATPEKPAPTTARGTAKGEFDLSLVPAETKLVVAVQPAILLGRPEMRGVTRIPALPGQSNAIRLDEIDQYIAFWDGNSPQTTGPASVPLISIPSGLILRTANPCDWKEIIATYVTTPQEARHAGHGYYRPGGSARTPYCAYTPDGRTLVLAIEDSLQSLIEDRAGPRAGHAWDEAWNQTARGQLKAAVETRWLRRRLNQGQILDRPGNGARPIAYESVAPLLEKTRAFALSVDVDNQPLSDLVATVGAAEDLKDVKETMQAVLTLGKNAVASLRQDRRDEPRAAVEASHWALGLFASALENSTLESAGQTIHLRSTAPVDMAEASRILMSFVNGARADMRRMQSVNNLKQIGLAFHNYHSDKNGFPPPVLYGGRTGRVPYSWRVAILPYLVGQELYNQYNFDEPWDGPNNRKLIDQMPAVYGYPGTGLKPGHTAYFVLSGPEAALGKGEKPTITDITDGAHLTILAVEARREVPWTKPEDIPFDSHVALPELGGFTPDGFNVLFGDGSVRLIKKSIDPNVLKALITRAGGEVISADSF